MIPDLIPEDVLTTFPLELIAADTELPGKRNAILIAGSRQQDGFEFEFFGMGFAFGHRSLLLTNNSVLGVTG